MSQALYPEHPDYQHLTSLLEKYNTQGPRYTSYPTAPTWTEAYTQENHQHWLKETNAQFNPHPLSLYTHLPFCEHRCLFCGCNVVITQQREQAEKYLGYLFKEIEQVASLMDTSRPVVQYHWGGGTPTYLSPEQIERLFKFQTSIFKLDKQAEVAIEVDPRVTSHEQIQVLKELGFNRLSFGVQDFEPKVQEAVERIQPLEMTENFLQFCRDQGFSGGINFDLIYGLPHQTTESFSRTINEVIRLSPDRIALYNLAYVPWMAGHQKGLDPETLPEIDIKFAIFKYAIEAFTNAGYVYIGMDHFAKPDDELTVALRNGTLHRNFMGYTVKNQVNDKETDMVGVGVSSISILQRQYAQNVKKLSEYYEAIDAKRLPVHRGYELNDDDVFRRALILAILCQGKVDYSEFQKKFGVDIETVCKDALKELKPLAEDGLIEWTCSGFEVTELGRIFSRNIAMPFDAYLKAQKESNKPTFSKTV